MSALTTTWFISISYIHTTHPRYIFKEEYIMLGVVNKRFPKVQRNGDITGVFIIDMT